MKKVLIITSHFPPLNSMASKRYGCMSKYMEENGFEPYIITMRPRGGCYLNAKLDLQIPIPDERIIRIGDVGIRYPCLDDEIYGVLERYKEDNTQSRIIEDESIGWYYKVKSELDRDLIKDIDIVVGTFPAIGNILVGRYIAELLKKPFIAEIRDLISDYSEGMGKSLVYQNLEKQLEKQLIGDVAGIIAVTSGFGAILKERYPDSRIATIYNGWDNDFNKKRISRRNNGEYLYYAGTLYEHRIRSIKLLIDVIKENRLDISLKIRSLGPENLENDLKSYVLDNEIQEKVEILKAVDEKIVQEEQAMAKINLLVSSLDHSDRALMTTLPGKLFELIRLEKPVLAIVDDAAEVAHVLKATKKGKAASNKEDILAFLNSDLTVFEGFHEEVAFYSRKEQTKHLCTFLENILEAEDNMKNLVLNGLSFITGTVSATIASEIKLNKVIANKQQEKEKFRIMYQLMERWIRLKIQGKSIASYFEAYGYKNIAVYGVSDIGQDLLEDLNNTSVKVEYAIDKAVSNIAGISIVRPEDELKEVDAIVVTAIAYFGEINEFLSKKVNCPIVSLEDIIYEMA